MFVNTIMVEISYLFVNPTVSMTNGNGCHVNVDVQWKRYGDGDNVSCEAGRAKWQHRTHSDE